jgi:hypothetical protein
VSQARVPPSNRWLVVTLVTAGIFILFMVYLAVVVSAATTPIRDVELLDLRQPADQRVVNSEQDQLPHSAIPVVVLVDSRAGNPCARAVEDQKQPTYCAALTNRAVIQISADNREPAQVMTVLYGDSLVRGGGRYAQLWRSKPPVGHALGRPVLIALLFSVLLGALFSVAVWVAGQRRPGRSPRAAAPGDTSPRAAAPSGAAPHGGAHGGAHAGGRATPATPPAQQSWTAPGPSQTNEHPAPPHDVLMTHQPEPRPAPPRGPVPHVFRPDALEIARAAGHDGEAVARTFLGRDGGYVSLNGLLVWAAAPPGSIDVAEPGDRLRVVGADPGRTTVLVQPAPGG